MVVTQRFYIGFNMIDENFNIKNSALLNFFVDVAGIHSSRCGENFETSPTRWLLLGYKLQIFKRPKYGEFIDVSTWSSEIRGITALREFEVRNEKGELLVAALSNWVSINITSRRMERLTEERMAPYKSEPQRTNFENKTFEKILQPETLDGKVSFVVDWKLIDLNNHLNNANYLEVVQNILPRDLCENLHKYNFEVVYKKEIPLGEEVDCFYKNNEQTFEVVFKNKNTQELHAAIKFIK